MSIRTAAGDTAAGSRQPVPAPCFDHLRHLTGPYGLWEHARYLTPRQEHGYCLDDNARALIVMCHQRDPTLDGQTDTYLRFVREAGLPDGRFHNRRNANGDWVDLVGSDDAHGRALWAAGTLATLGDPGQCELGLALFERHSALDADALRPWAFAMLGSREVLRVQPGNPSALSILRQGAIRIRATGERWQWPEPRLRYDNARLPEALLAAGEGLVDDRLVDEGLDLLQWLVGVETRNGRFSFTPTAGWGPGEPRPGFDQQPVEAAAMADACFRAWRLTQDGKWKERLRMAVGWLLGENDTLTPLYDARTGGCRDGLTRRGANQNQGAESTLSALSALQRWAEAA